MDESFIERTEIPQPEPAYALADLLGVPVPDLGRRGCRRCGTGSTCSTGPRRPTSAPTGTRSAARCPLPLAPAGAACGRAAGSRAQGPLRCGEPATKRTRVLAVTEKHGRSGHLTFVTVGVQVLQGGAVVVDEEQDIVYRDAAPGPAGAGGRPAAAARAPAPVVPAGQGEREIGISPTLLFRFSALTYNAHRIHYDRDYCRDVEGYPGLLTHGPLQALAMAEAARAVGSDTAAGPGTCPSRTAWSRRCSTTRA